MRFYQTVRMLRARQAAAQVEHRLRNRLERPSPPTDQPGIEDIRLQPLPFIPPVQSAANANMAQTGRLTFLNRTLNVGRPATWAPQDATTLWAYNLHYHDFLWVLSFEDAISVVRDWINRYTLARGRLGWDPYPTSIRVQNWCMYFFGDHRDKAAEDSSLAEELWVSMFHQISRLETRIERHLLANHILENGAALAIAGATFGGLNGERWLRKGLTILRQHLDEMVLPDGGHAERSPMYHARLCQMLENLARTGNEQIADVVANPKQRAQKALPQLCHPDLGIALLNDSALGVYPGLTELGVQPAEPGRFALPDSGYYGGRTKEGHYVVCDVGPVGPAYQPGHAHGDTLSFELSVNKLRFVVDSGVYSYEEDRWRNYARSTRAHNTVELNRLDQSDFWGAFRVGRRAYPRDVVYGETETGFALQAEHSGYDHLSGHPVHRRNFRWFQDGVLMVRDHVRGASPVWARSHLHVHPEATIELLDDRMVLLRRSDVTCYVGIAGAGRLTVEPSWYFPEFGVRFGNRVLVLSSRGSDVVNGFCIVPGETRPAFDLERGARVGDAEYSW